MGTPPSVPPGPLKPWPLWGSRWVDPAWWEGGKKGVEYIEGLFFLNYNSVCLCLLGEVAYLGPLSGLSVTGARQLKKKMHKVRVAS